MTATDPTSPGGRAADDDERAVRPGALVLVTGASGYIGGRLVGELLDAGYRVRCLVRTPAKLGGAPWIDRVEVVQGDVHGDLTAALDGVDALHYLVHTIGGSSDWIEQDRLAAENVRDQATAAGVRRIVYLGGLGDDATGQLSPHLASRHEVG
ncbi:MAG: NAD(P)H-binding protein, partial [Acidimicrobiales bacterium]